jgi:hypothetical protein
MTQDATRARILDAGDFKAWLLDAAEVAAACETVQRFLTCFTEGHTSEDLEFRQAAI